MTRCVMRMSTTASGSWISTVASAALAAVPRPCLKWPSYSQRYLSDILVYANPAMCHEVRGKALVDAQLFGFKVFKRRAVSPPFVESEDDRRNRRSVRALLSRTRRHQPGWFGLKRDRAGWVQMYTCVSAQDRSELYMTCIGTRVAIRSGLWAQALNLGL
jgi:hypothetical protein